MIRLLSVCSSNSTPWSLTKGALGNRICLSVTHTDTQTHTNSLLFLVRYTFLLRRACKTFHCELSYVGDNPSASLLPCSVDSWRMNHRNRMLVKVTKKMNLCSENDLGSGNLKAEEVTGGQFTLQTLLSATQKEITDTCWTVVS